MNLEVWTGYWLFFLVPLIIFAGCFLLIKRGESLTVKAVAFIAGSDNRLSLSRLQALTWSLVIYGSFFAAMAVHNVIAPVSASEQKEYTDAANKAKERMAVLKDSQNKAETDKTTAEDEKNNADNAYTVAETKLKTLADRKADAAEIETAKTALVAAQDEVTTRIGVLKLAQKKLEDTQGKIKADDEAIKIEHNLNWVEIPAELLALAGIAIGSGIFSSFISAVNKEEKSACVTSIESISAEEFNDETKYPDTPPTTSNNLMKINGKDMDGTGRVRLGMGKAMTTFAPILYWKSNGTEIVVEIPTDAKFDTLVVDTPNGKLSYKLDDLFDANQVEAANKLFADTSKLDAANNGALSKAKESLDKLTAENADAAKIDEAKAAVDALQAAVTTSTTNLTAAKTRVKELENSRVKSIKLGIAKYFYEFSDLFRDDKNPSTMDLMKFQMFGWTVVAVTIYAWLFLAHMSKDIATLPLVPQAIVILTGLSQAGYLAGKGVSNIQANQSQGTTNQTISNQANQNQGTTEQTDGN